eukprot:scaffold3594_cov188-Prasinococcus_capsulatus_cf.AAC.1
MILRPEGKCSSECRARTFGKLRCRNQVEHACSRSNLNQYTLPPDKVALVAALQQAQLGCGREVAIGDRAVQHKATQLELVEGDNW